MQKPIQFALFGNYGAQNLGDDLILEAILKSHPHIDWVVFAADPQKIKEECKKAYLFPTGIRSSLRGTFWQSFRALKACDAAVIGGGGLFQDNYPLAPLIWTWQFLCCRFLQKPIFIYATSVGPLRHYFARKMTGWVYKRAKVITVRDQDSKKLLRQLGLKDEKILVSADPVLSFDMTQRNIEKEKKSLVIAIRPCQEHTKKVIESIKKLIATLKQQNWTVCLLVMQEGTLEDDGTMTRNIQAKYPDLMVHNPTTNEEFQAIMQQTTLVISMRFHCLLLALMSNVPTIGINYGHKIRALFRDLQISTYCLEVSELSSTVLIEKIAAIQDELPQLLPKIGTQILSLKKKSELNISAFDEFSAKI